MRTLIHSTWILSVIAIGAAQPSQAQCTKWDPRFNAPGGTNNDVFTLLGFDDGGGPALYVGGVFDSAGGAPASHIAKWDGATWSPLGTGLDWTVRTLAVFDDGSGPALYAGGHFVATPDYFVRRVAKWDGSVWSPLGAGLSGPVFSLCVFDDGTGPALYAGGEFGWSGEVATGTVAKWDGTAWSGLPGDVEGFVHALIVFDDGTGPALYVGGSFTRAGGVDANCIAKYDGTNWSALGTGTDERVESLGVYDDGSGPALHVGGYFHTAGGVSVNHVAKWDGASWSPLGTGVADNIYGWSSVDALSVFDDGEGPALYAGGPFDSVGGVSGTRRIAKWDGSTWTSLGSGANANVRTLAVFDDGRGAQLWAGGSFTVAAGVGTYHVASWDGSRASPLGATGLGLTHAATALRVLDDGSGPALYAGGEFRGAGGSGSNCVAKWSVTEWSPLGDGFPSGVDDNYRVQDLAVFDNGTGPVLYAGGNMSWRPADGSFQENFARWNGIEWLGTGQGVGRISALAVYDDGSGEALYAGGFSWSIGDTHFARIAKWDGLQWSALPQGFNAEVHALLVFDDGSGSSLFAGGEFNATPATSYISKWNGSFWAPLGAGMYGTVEILCAFDDGSGPALYLGGPFTQAGHLSTSRIAKWDGTSWSTLGTGMSGGTPVTTVNALAVFDDGSGPALYAGGSFTTAGGVAANNLAKWDGSSWSAVAGGVNGVVYSLAAFDDGADGAPDLYVGGDFDRAGTTESAHIAVLHGCRPGEAYCFGDGIDPVVTADCPCGNFGAPGHGCANSNSSLGGARMTAAGGTNPNTVEFTCTSIPNGNLCTFLRSPGYDPSGVVFGDGVRCVSGPIVRFGQQVAGEDGNEPNTARAEVATVASGNTRYYQLHYRNPAPAFCPSGAFNVSNGYVIHW